MLSSARRFLSNRYGWAGFTLRVRLQRLIWDALGDRSISALLDQSCLYKRSVPALVGDDAIRQDPRFVSNSLFNSVFTQPQTEFVYRLRAPLLIEPKYGYLLTKRAGLIDASVPRSEFTKDRANMEIFYGLPSLSIIPRLLRVKLPVVEHESVVLLRYPHDGNYYHTYQDVLSRLAMLDEAGIDERIPLVVFADLAKQPFFQTMQKRGALRHREWIVQGDAYISSSDVVISRTTEGNRARLDYFLGLIDAPSGDRAYKRRVFLTRKADSRRRAILNLAEIRPILEARGFEILDAEDLSFEEQMTLFSQTEILVGVHGAGLTNMIFRRDAPMKILEIFSPRETPLHFYVMARAYGFEHSYIVGHSPESEDRSTNFSVDPDELDRALHNLLSSDS